MIDFKNGTMELGAVIKELTRQGASTTGIIDMLNETTGFVENGVNYVEVKGLEAWLNNEHCWDILCSEVVMFHPEC